MKSLAFLNGRALFLSGCSGVSACIRGIRQWRASKPSPRRRMTISDAPEVLEIRRMLSAVVTVNATSDVHAIDPNIYGAAFATTAQLSDLNLTVNRNGGNTTNTYNWQTDDSNHANDYYFESISDGSGNGQSKDAFVSQTEAGGAQADLTVPIIPYVAQTGANNSILGSFPVSVYGQQQSTDPYDPNFGNGVNTQGQNITDTNPLYDYVANSPAFEQGWIQHLLTTFGNPGSGGVQYFTLGNEPGLWNSTNRDVHPNGETNTELLNDIINYGSMIKSIDPNAQILAGEEWGWTNYFVDGADAAAGNYGATYDGLNVQQWLLQQLQQYQAAHGVRLMDYYTLHYYPQEGAVDSNAVDQSTELLRNQVTRSLWDPNYVDPSWIGTTGINDGKIDLIPMMQSWVNQYYPGTKTGITEYNFGAEGDMNGATTQADVYGIFGQQDLDLATRWTTPATNSPTYLAMKLWRNYDGHDSGFGDQSVSASVGNPDQTDAFSAIRSSDGALTVAVINKNLYDSSNPTATTSVTINMNGFASSGDAQNWQLAAINPSDQTTAAITNLADIHFTGNSFTINVPMESVTMLVIEPASQSQAPTITSAAHTTFTLGSAGSFTVTATGTPAPTFSETGALPSGVTFNTTTGVLSGTPNASSAAGAYPLQFIADNSAGKSSPQAFTLTVAYPDSIVSDQSTGYAETAGTWSTSASTGYNVLAMRTSTSAGATANFTPKLSGAGTYQVSFYNPALSGAATVKITVFNNNLANVFTVNEASGSAGFVTLGNLYFLANGSEYVSVSSSAGTIYTSALQFAREGYTPTMTAPASQSTLLNTALVFSTANSKALSVGDSSTGSNSVQLAISAGNGIVNLGGTSGLSFTSGANGSASFTIQGTVAAINTALSGLKFTPTGNFAGAATLGLTFSDLGVGGAGPIQTVSRTVAITVKYLTTVVVDQQTGYSESAGTWTTSSVTGYNGVATRASSSTNAMAVWTPTLAAGTYLVSIYLPAASGATTDAFITVVHRGVTNTYLVNEASGTAGFFNLGNLYFTGAGGEYISISQGATVGTLYASAVQFSGEESTPAFTGPATQSTLQNTVLVFSSANSNLISIGNTSLGNNIVQLALSSTGGTLTLGGTSGLNFIVGANGSAGFTVQGTVTAINAAIAVLQFTPTTNLVGAANITLVFGDRGVGGAGPAQNITKTIGVTVKYPVITVVDQQTGYTEPAGTWSTSGVTGYGGAATRVSTSANAAATWTPTLAAGTYLVAVYLPATSGATTDAKVTVVHNFLTNTYTVNQASGTAGFYNLGNLAFSGAGGEYISISQGATVGTLYASAVQLSEEDSSPIYVGPTTQNTPVNTALVFSAANSNAISISNTNTGSNIVQLALSVTNGTLALGGTSGLTFIVGVNNSASFTVQGTMAAINTALNGLKYTPTTNFAGSASLSLSFNDKGVGGAGPAQSLSKTIAITV